MQWNHIKDYENFTTFQDYINLSLRSFSWHDICRFEDDASPYEEDIIKNNGSTTSKLCLRFTLNGNTSLIIWSCHGGHWKHIFHQIIYSKKMPRICIKNVYITTRCWRWKLPYKRSLGCDLKAETIGTIPHQFEFPLIAMNNDYNECFDIYINYITEK